MNLGHLKVTQAGLVAVLTAVIGQIVALVPQWAPEKSTLIQGGSFAIAAGFMFANALHHLADSNVSATDIRADAVQFARTEAHAVLDKIDLRALVEQVISAKDPIAAAEAAARDEARRLFAGLQGLLGQQAATPTAGTGSQTPAPTVTQTAPPAA